MKQERSAAIDIAKGIGVILVVFGHMNTYPSIIQKIIYSFHIPMFFLLAGLVFSCKPGGGIAAHIRQGKEDSCSCVNPGTV